MIEGKTYQYNFLRVILEGYQRVNQVTGAIGFLCDKVIGILGGVATDTGIFKNTRVTKSKNDGVIRFKADYCRAQYNLEIRTQKRPNDVKITFEAKRKIPKKTQIGRELYNGVNDLVFRYIKQANSGGS